MNTTMTKLGTKHFVNFRKSQVGFTLMEVLIAMAIGLVVLVSALSYFGTGVKAVQTADAFSRMHESGSRAAAIISRDIQLAGFYGFGGSANARNIMGTDGNLYSIGGEFTPPLEDGFYTDANDCGARYILPLQSDERAMPIEYYKTKVAFADALGAAANSDGADFNGGTTSAPNVDDCVPDILDDSPVLVMRGALEGEMIIDNNVLKDQFTSSLSPKQLYIAAVPTASLDIQNVIYFFGPGASEKANDMKNFSWARAHEDGLIQQKSSKNYFPIFNYQFRVYYIRDYFIEPGDNTPTLVRRQLTEGDNEYSVKLTTERMVAGVERINFLWGIDNKGEIRVNTGTPIGDGVTDYWIDALSSTDFDKINSVRLQLLVRSTGVDAQYRDTDITYHFDGMQNSVDEFNCKDLEAQYPDACLHRRLLYESSSSVRNCSLRRRGGLLQTGGC